MKTRQLILVAILVTAFMALTACGSDPCVSANANAKAATNSNANANVAPGTVTSSVEGTTFKITVEGQLTPPTESSRYAAETAAKSRKYKADIAADRKAMDAVAPLSKAHSQLTEAALAEFKATDYPSFSRFLEYRVNYDFKVLDDLQKTSTAYKAYEAKLAKLSQEMTDAKAAADMVKEQEKFLNEMVLAKELEMIAKKYGKD